LKTLGSSLSEAFSSLVDEVGCNDLIRRGLQVDVTFFKASGSFSTAFSKRNEFDFLFDGSSL
jgi:hypothetical protein